MKHKCAANGCGNRAIYVGDGYVSCYCREHQSLAQGYGERDRLPQVHDGRKVGKPSSWRNERRWKEQGVGDTR